MNKVWLAFVAGLAIMAGAAYLWIHHDENSDRKTVETDSLGRKMETIAIGEVVDDIRSLNRLVVFQAYVTAVTTTHDVGWFTKSDQTMITPAYVNYFVDMGAITSKQIRINGNEVYIQLPPLMIERPNIDTLNTQTFNNGIWSNLSGTADKMRLSNNKMALKQLSQRANKRFLVAAARRAETVAVEANLQTVLAKAGRSNIRVHVVAGWLPQVAPRQLPTN